MFITLIAGPLETSPTYTIAVAEDHAADVVGALMMQGWYVLSKFYEPSSSMIDPLGGLGGTDHAGSARAYVASASAAISSAPVLSFRPNRVR